MRIMRRAAVMGGAGLLLTARRGLAGSGGTAIESHYAKPGALPVLRQDVSNGRYSIWSPDPIGTGRPIVSWGNGTASHPDTYAALLADIAAWGFCVIAAQSGEVGSGFALLDAAEYLVAQNATPGSFFAGALNVGAVAAAGTSQGAEGAINAATGFDQSSLFTAVLANALPANGATVSYDVGQLAVPVFFQSGSRDTLISTAQVNNRAYAATRPGLPAVRGRLIGAGHTEVEGDGGGDRGYLIAWLRATLLGDKVAGQAFAGSFPEILRNPRYTLAATKNAPQIPLG